MKKLLALVGLAVLAAGVVAALRNKGIGHGVDDLDLDVAGPPSPGKFEDAVVADDEPDAH